LLEDDPLTGDGVAGNPEQLNTRILCGNTGDAGIRVDLKDGVVNVEGLTIAMCDIPR
jgi:hypothetical protein